MFRSVPAVPLFNHGTYPISCTWSAAPSSCSTYVLWLVYCKSAQYTMHFLGMLFLTPMFVYTMSCTLHIDDKGEPLFFSYTTPQYGSLRHVLLNPKTDQRRGKKKLLWYRMEISCNLEVHDENRAEKKWRFFSDDFGLRSPVIQKTFSPKKGIPLS